MSSTTGADSGIFLPARDVCQHERVQAGPPGGRIPRLGRRPAPVGLDPARIRPDQPAGPRVRVRFVPNTSVDRSHFRLQTAR